MREVKSTEALVYQTPTTVMLIFLIVTTKMIMNMMIFAQITEHHQIGTIQKLSAKNAIVFFGFKDRIGSKDYCQERRD